MPTRYVSHLIPFDAPESHCGSFWGIRRPATAYQDISRPGIGRATTRCEVIHKRAARIVPFQHHLSDSRYRDTPVRLWEHGVHDMKHSHGPH